MKLGATDLDVFPLCLGGNVFGRGADEAQSFEILDAYARAGGNFLDTADIYAGGASEQIIGNWMKDRGNREQIVLATKVGMAPGSGLSSSQIEEALAGSLSRLKTDYIDLYYAHQDDEDTPLQETARAFDALVKDGRVRCVAASNYSAERLSQALSIAASEGLASYAAVQPHYNLVVRDEYEGDLQKLCVSENVPCLPYFSLAQGFLTGKYRPGGPQVQSRRADSATKYLDERGRRVLHALDEISAAHETSLAAVSLAWLAAQPGVATPIASARTLGQLRELLPLATLSLAADELQRLTAASS